MFNIGEDFEDNAENKRRNRKNSDDGEEYVLEDQDKPYSKPGERNEEGGEDHSEMVYADSKSHSYRLDLNPDEEMKEGSNKDNARTFELGASVDDRTDPMGGVHESDAGSSKESMRRREMKRQQKYPIEGFHRPKQMPYSNHSYTDLFPVFCGHCLSKVDLSYPSWQCKGHCGKIYHEDCKNRIDEDFRERVRENINPNEWLCWLCCQGKAECFICKQIDYVKWNARKPVPSYIKNNPALAEYHKGGSSSHDKKEASRSEEKESKPKDYSESNPDNSQKEPHLIKNEDGMEKETEIKFRFDDPPPVPRSPVS